MQVLVHGEATVMARLKAALLREYEDNQVYTHMDFSLEIFSSRHWSIDLCNFERYNADLSYGICVCEARGWGGGEWGGEWGWNYVHVPAYPVYNVKNETIALTHCRTWTLRFIILATLKQWSCTSVGRRWLRWWAPWQLSNPQRTTSSLACWSREDSTITSLIRQIYQVGLERTVVIDITDLSDQV